MAYDLCQKQLKSLRSVCNELVKSSSTGLPIEFKTSGNMVNLIPDSWFNYKPYMNGNSFDRDAYAESHRVIDISCNSGVLLEHFYHKFMRELSRAISDSFEREDYILKNLLYVFCTDARLIRLLRMRFYWSNRCEGNIYHYNILNNSGVDKSIAREVLNSMKFDVVCGNPPYQNSNGGGSIYQDFACKMYELTNNYVLIICPDRWNLSTQSNSFDTLRKYLIDNKSLCKIVHIASNAGKTFVFPDTGTKELTYFLASKSKNSSDCLLVELDYEGNLINKGNIELCGTLYYSINFMSILSKIKSKCSSSLFDIVELVTYDELDSRQFNSASDVYSLSNPIKAYGSRGAVKYVNSNYFTHDYKAIPLWKVLLARSGSSSTVGEPNSVGSRHLYMIRFNSKTEADNCCDFCQTKLFRFLRTNSTAGMASSFDSFKNLPLIDFNRSWTDDDLNKYFDFSADEINFINSYTH